MGKSDFKKVVAALAPHAVQITQPDCAAVVIHDTLVELRKWGHTVLKKYEGISTVHLDQIIEDVFRPAFAAYPNAKLHVHLFDKASYVTRAKDSEQATRDKQVEVIEHFNSDITKLVVPQAGCSPQTWNMYINDRKFRQILISKLCTRATELLPKMMRDCSVVLDYEQHNPIAAGGGTCAQIATVHGDQVPKSTIAQMGNFLPNTLGEFDVAFLNYVQYSNQFANDVADGRSVVIDSVDTDILPIAMLNYAHDTPNYFIQLPFAQNKYLFDVEACVNWATTTFNTHPNPVDVCARLYIHAGSDFVEGVPGITAENFVLDYIQNFSDLDPCKYKQQLLCSDLARLSGVRNATAKQKALRKQTRAADCVLRADFTLNYWKYSVFEKHNLYSSPIGHGFSLHAGKIISTEQVEQLAKKRLKL